MSEEPTVDELPRFVQVRGYDKGTLTARVVIARKGPDWFWTRPLIEGTRLDPRDVASHVAAHGVDDALLMWPHLTPEQIAAAIAWRAAHPRWRPPRGEA